MKKSQELYGANYPLELCHLQWSHINTAFKMFSKELLKNVTTIFMGETATVGNFLKITKSQSFLSTVVKQWPFDTRHHEYYPSLS